MIRIEDVIDKVSENRPGSDIDLIRRAYLFSALHHRGQTRASGEPYLIHPLEVADILADMRLDEVSVSTGLLHDVVEDTLVDLDTIRAYFGDEITLLVDGLTKIANISDLSKERQQAENVRKMVLADVLNLLSSLDRSLILTSLISKSRHKYAGSYRDVQYVFGSRDLTIGADADADGNFDVDKGRCPEPGRCPSMTSSIRIIRSKNCFQRQRRAQSIVKLPLRRFFTQRYGRRSTSGCHLSSRNSACCDYPSRRTSLEGKSFSRADRLSFSG